MSGGLAPSKSTVYVSNLPFSLTNNDIAKIFEKYGKVVKVTIVKDKYTRTSKGIAFVLYLKREDAWKAIRSLNNTEMFGRNLKCSVAKDNGRASEFIRRKVYPDKSKCYECGEEGHMSYNCPKNLLGEREPPKKKERKRKGDHLDDGDSDQSDNDDSEKGPQDDSLAAAIQYQQQKMSASEELSKKFIVPSGSYEEDEPKRKHYKKDAYFSDEEELSD
ncbi:zinc finger CCHC-type and RNA-binding motif-containing protein 1-like [Lineus longissimus]|uniref:zinc finger CCHC-type and RNA-binding motif-containing protein 1-like n=1 Tax=Lineus longissimus TaxID=88925 RepID=UPI002B4CD84A